jgi:hypothetical protein
MIVDKYGNYTVPKSKNHCSANDLSVTVISNRKCHEKGVIAPQWFFDFGTTFIIDFI